MLLPHYFVASTRSNMRSTTLLLLAAPSALAFPWLKPEGLEALLNHPEARAEIQRRLQNRAAAPVEPRQLGTGLIPGLVDLLGGTVKAVLDPVLGLIPTSDSVNGLKRFPERMYPLVHSLLVANQHQPTTLSKLLALLISVVLALVSIHWLITAVSPVLPHDDITD
jgi:hypothetical protein